MHILELNEREFELLKLLLEFHAGMDPDDEPYDWPTFEALCAKCAVEVPEASDEQH